jgi:RHS repeat-associated protein
MACKGNGGSATNLDGSILTLTSADELLFDDGIGTLTEETGATGAARATFATYPYGLTRFDTSAQTRKYAKSPRDESVGLDQMGARSFAPDLGVWTSADPVAVEDPNRGIGTAPGTSNPYAYAGQNPTIASDEHGHWLQIAIGAGIGALVGGGLEAYHQYAETGHVESWGRVAEKALVGGVAGGAFAAVPTPATLGAVLALGGAESTATGVANRLIDSGGKSAGTLGDAAADFVTGAATAGVAAGAGVVLKKVAGAVLARTGSAAREVGHGLQVKSGIKAGGSSGAAAKTGIPANAARRPSFRKATIDTALKEAPVDAAGKPICRTVATSTSTISRRSGLIGSSR